MTTTVVQSPDSGEIGIVHRMANRHGLIAGATGSGKTVTVQKMCEVFSKMGVPVFVADIKGDLSGMALPGGDNPGIAKAVERFDLLNSGFEYTSLPCEFWDLIGREGTKLNVSIQSMGPTLLARVMEISSTQTSCLNVVFQICKDNDFRLSSVRDLRDAIEHMNANIEHYTEQYGYMSKLSIGAIQRAITNMETTGLSQFFGDPCFQFSDFLRKRGDQGYVNILACEYVYNHHPEIYTTFLIWLLQEMARQMPEVGDCDKPKFVLFFDESHILFDGTPKNLVKRIEKTVRLIRSKGVGVYFISQSPNDIPDKVLDQLGNRIQHAIRASTAKAISDLKKASATFAINPKIDVAKAMQSLKTGECLVSFLDADGTPRPVQRGYVLPPQSQIGPLDDGTRAMMIHDSIMNKKYVLPSYDFDHYGFFEAVQDSVRNGFDWLCGTLKFIIKNIFTNAKKI